MQIDWFTTAAQLINFLILIWILKKLLYRPIMRAMEHREQGLLNQQQRAEALMLEAEKLKLQYQQRLQQLESERDALLAQSKQQAEEQRAQQLLKLEQEMQQKKSDFRTQMEQQQAQLGDAFRRAIGQKALQISNKILSELADCTLERQMIAHFFTKLSQLPTAERDLLQQALQQQNSVSVFTGFAIDEAARNEIQTWLKKTGSTAEISFAQRDAVICGITVEAGGHSWEWNVERYLSELDVNLISGLGHSA